MSVCLCTRTQTHTHTHTHTHIQVLLDTGEWCPAQISAPKNKALKYEVMFSGDPSDKVQTLKRTLYNAFIDKVQTLNRTLYDASARHTYQGTDF